MSYVGVSGQWKRMLAGSGGGGTAVGVSGQWKSIREMYVGVSGQWKRFFPAGDRIVVTVANQPGFSGGIGFTITGLDPNPHGSVDPETYSGADIFQIIYLNNATIPSLSYIQVILSGHRAQSFFDSIIIQRTDGDFDIMETASADEFETATHGIVGQFTRWRWITGAIGTWTTHNQQRDVFFV